MQEPVDRMLTNAATLDGRAELQTDQDIAIHGGCITGVYSAGDPNRPVAREIVDCSGCLVTPGLVVLHGHSPMVLMRGLAEDVRIEEWFNGIIWPFESRLTPDDIAVGARLAIAEMIDNGVTAFADHYFFADRIADAVIETGIRADLAPTLFGLAPDIRDQIAVAVRLIEQRHGEADLLSFRMGPHAPYTCPPDILSDIVNQARSLGVGIHIHVSESRAQVEESMARHGKTPFEMVAAAGGFELPAIVAHGLWITERDRSLIAPDTWLAVSPKTYMKLAMGAGNLWRFHDTLNLAAGTDGAASSNTISPLEQARLWALAGKWLAEAAERFDVTAAWQFLMNGHRALNRNTGVIAPGYEADLTVWDLNTVHTAPVHHPLAALIYSADARNVRDVLVRGRFLKRDGTLQTIDWDEVIRQARQIAARLHTQGRGETGLRY